MCFRNKTEFAMSTRDAPQWIDDILPPPSERKARIDAIEIFAQKGNQPEKFYRKVLAYIVPELRKVHNCPASWSDLKFLTKECWERVDGYRFRMQYSSMEAARPDGKPINLVPARK